MLAGLEGMDIRSKCADLPHAFDKGDSVALPFSQGLHALAGPEGVDIREHARAVPGHRSTPSDLSRDSLRSAAAAVAAAMAAAARCDAVPLPFGAAGGMPYPDAEALCTMLPSRAAPGKLGFFGGFCSP